MAKRTKGGLQRFADGARVKKGKGMAALGVMSRLGSDADAMMNARRAGNTQFGDIGPSTQGIIKDVGGNWLPSYDSNSPYQQNLDIALKGLKRGQYDTKAARIKQLMEEDAAKGDTARKAQMERSLAEAQRKEAANNWVDSNLRNYITKQMATESDPVRLLAEKEISAFPKIEDEYGDLSLKSGSWESEQRRRQTGFPKRGVAQSDLARHYEVLADEAISPRKAEIYQKEQALPEMQRPRGAQNMPWVNKLDPESHIYQLSQDADFERLGFNHIMDVLREDLAAGRIRPEQLNKMSMEQAVRRTHEYDEALKAKMLEARQKEMGEAKLHREYPEGYKWVQLDRPGQFALESDVMGHSVRGYEPERGHPDWIEASGESGHESYGHGGYEAIKSGKAKVYSLRDPKGMSHVTVEVGEHPQPYPVSGEAFAMLPSATKAQYGQHVREWRQRNPHIEDLTDEHTAQALREAGVEPQPPIISQIKGKQNSAPNDVYQPFVEDFVKGGNWSNVKDLHNTNLISLDPNSVLAKRIAAGGEEVPRYLTQDELTKFGKKYNEGYAAGGNVPKYAGAGSVKKGKGMAAVGLFDRLGADASMLVSARNNTKFEDLAPKTAGVIKEAGGNWLTGNIESGVDPLLQKQMIGNKYHAYGPEYQAAAKARVEELRKEASKPNYNGGAPRVIEAIEQGMASPEAARKAALNKWVEKNVTNYIKNEMGTEGDRVRKLLEDRWNAVETKYKKAEQKAEAMQAKRDAEPDARKHPMMDRQIQQFKAKAKQEYEDERQHIGHIPRLHEDPYRNRRQYDELSEERQRLGYPPRGQANAPTAQNWENLTDSQIETAKAWELNHFANTEKNPWLNQVDPRSSVHQLKSKTGTTGHELGINHIIDRLEQAIEGGTLKPEKLQAITMDQAVRMAADMDLADTRKRREAALKAAQNLKIEKDYPEKGMRWVDLAAKNIFDENKLPEGWSWKEPKNGLERLSNDKENKVILGKTKQEAIDEAHKRTPEFYDQQRKDLRKELEYESDIMGHCVGRSSNYCDKVMGNQGRILSLRDEANEPHVTLEANRRSIGTWDDVTHALGKDRAKKLYEEFLNGPTDNLQTFLRSKQLPTYFEELEQIKGKGNAKPVEKYLTYVQDLMREKDLPMSPTSRDFANTGFDYHAVGPNGIFDEEQIQTLGNNGIKVPRYLTADEMRKHQDDLYRIETGNDPATGLPLKPEEGMKEGGHVGNSHIYHQFARDYDLPHLNEGGQPLEGADRDRAEILRHMHANIADMKAKHFDKGGPSYQEPFGAPDSALTPDQQDTVQAYKDAGRNAYYNDKRHLVTPKGKKEFALQVAANYAGQPADLATAALEGMGNSPTLQIVSGMANRLASKVPALSKPLSVLDPNGQRVVDHPIGASTEALTKRLEPYTSEGLVNKLGHEHKFYSAPLAAMAADMGAGAVMPSAKIAKNGSRIYPIEHLQSLPKPAH
jgi:hypothetical protein